MMNDHLAITRRPRPTAQLKVTSLDKYSDLPALSPLKSPRHTRIAITPGRKVEWSGVEWSEELPTQVYVHLCSSLGAGRWNGDRHHHQMISFRLGRSLQHAFGSTPIYMGWGRLRRFQSVKIPSNLYQSPPIHIPNKPSVRAGSAPRADIRLLSWI